MTNYTLFRETSWQSSDSRQEGFKAAVATIPVSWIEKNKQFKIYCPIGTAQVMFTVQNPSWTTSDTIGISFGPTSGANTGLSVNDSYSRSLPVGQSDGFSFMFPYGNNLSLTSLSNKPTFLFVDVPNVIFSGMRSATVMISIIYKPTYPDSDAVLWFTKALSANLGDEIPTVHRMAGSGYLASANITSTDLKLIYTMPSNKKGVVNIDLCNRSTTQAKITLYLSKTDTPTDADIIRSFAPVPHDEYGYNADKVAINSLSVQSVQMEPGEKLWIKVGGTTSSSTTTTASTSGSTTANTTSGSTTPQQTITTANNVTGLAVQYSQDLYQSPPNPFASLITK